MAYRYYMYGMHVESEIEIAEAVEDYTEGIADVVVRLGEMPEEIRKKQEESNEGSSLLFHARALYFRVTDVAEYLVEESLITVRPIADATTQPVKTFLLGSALGYCMVLRKMVVLHGGAVEYHGKGIIVTGESGAGKSTVTNALREKGFQFIADDVCALNENGDKMHINMAYPQQKLCRDAALKMGYELSDLIYINEQRDKFAVRLKDGYLAEGAEFDYLFELQISEDDKLSIERVEGHEKLHTIIRNIYRGESAFQMWGMPPEYMKKCLKIASTIEVYCIKRPAQLGTLPEIVDFITKVTE